MSGLSGSGSSGAISGALSGTNLSAGANLSVRQRNDIPSLVTEQVDVYTLRCNINYRVNYEGETGRVTCVPIASDAISTMTQNFTSNVNEFKSRKGRNVENFSQNTNGKCKARY
jgi:hypothetical protein